MPNMTAPLTSTEVAQRVGDNTKTILAERGRNLEWLAAEIGIDVTSILRAFSERVETWLLFDLAFYLEVAPDRLIGVAHAFTRIGHPTSIESRCECGDWFRSVGWSRGAGDLAAGEVGAWETKHRAEAFTNA